MNFVLLVTSTLITTTWIIRDTTYTIFEAKVVILMKCGCRRVVCLILFSTDLASE